MSQKVPDDVAKRVKQRVYQLADERCYLALGRTRSGAFMDQLVSEPTVGGRLADFLGKTQVRTYIKDAVLNRYSKDKMEGAKPVDFRPIIDDRIGISTEEIEDMGKGVRLFKENGGHPQERFVVVSEGTLIKWETALRKALYCIATLPAAQRPTSDFQILLSLFAQFKRLTDADKRLLVKSLTFCRTTPYIYGESD